jgi:spore coat polysaccharide biosynthesis protein SpsF
MGSSVLAVICITQARLGSVRLPQKVLMPLGNLNLLDTHMMRVKQSQTVDQHILAIPGTPDNQALASFCQKQGYTVFMGDENNVLSRYYHAALANGVKQNDTIIRLTGDCPLICPSLIDDVVKRHLTDNPNGYSHLNLAYWARGLDIELFSMALLQRTFEQASLPSEKEHVTYYMYTHPEQFNILSVDGGDSNSDPNEHKHWSGYRVCVDELDDFRMLTGLINELGDNWLQSHAVDICRVLEANPDLANINQLVAQKKSA